MSERTPFRLRSFGRLAEETGSAARNLWAQKTRTLLTGLGMVFGVGAVICMLAISAGARAQALHFIEELGVRNLFVTSLPARSVEEMQSRRKSSPGLTARDVRILQANLGGLEAISPRRTLHPVRLIPKPDGGGPELVGVGHAYASIHNLRISNGRFFDDLDDETAAAVCVLGENAKVQLLGYGIATGKFVKVNDTWLRVIGVLARQFRSSQRSSAAEADPDHAIYVPLRTFQYRFWDSGFLTDELDGIDLGLAPGVDSSQAARVVSTILNATHRNTPDFAVIVPAELLEQQQRTARIFAYVMVAIAAISLLVGGIGIMNIVLATVLERTR
ncbi:MAG: ABC transporter permease, partial [Bryobacteraceae bacterium]